ncbi:MAG TPA: YtxH domain-containing protein [Anaerolineaceae bacterium]|jgi:gas vesicle protein
MEDRVVIRKGSFGSWTFGLVFGSLIGGTIALLMAPQPGMQTRAQLAQTGGHIRERAKEAVEDARGRVTDVTGQARSRVGQVLSSVSGGSRSPSTDEAMSSDVKKVNNQVNVLESDIDKAYDL